MRYFPTCVRRSDGMIFPLRKPKFICINNAAFRQPSQSSGSRGTERSGRRTATSSQVSLNIFLCFEIQNFEEEIKKKHFVKETVVLCLCRLKNTVNERHWVTFCWTKNSSPFILLLFELKQSTFCVQIDSSTVSHLSKAFNHE